MKVHANAALKPAGRLALVQMGRWFGFRDGYKDLSASILSEGSTDPPSTCTRDLRPCVAPRSSSGTNSRVTPARKTGAPGDDHPGPGTPAGQATPRLVETSSLNTMYDARLVERRSPVIAWLACRRELEFEDAGDLILGDLRRYSERLIGHFVVLAR